MKAYTVQGDEYGCVVFAAHNIVARRNGANELNLGFNEVGCKRAPEFDEYSAIGKVPVQALLKAGWWWSCQNCGRTVFEDDCVIHDDVAYCCEACRDQELADQIMQKSRLQAWTDCANEKWHGVTVQHASESCGDADVSFTFPGGKNQVHWSTKDSVLHLPLIDHPAWAAFTGKPVEIIV